MLESDETDANKSMEGSIVLYYNKERLCNIIKHDLIMKYL